MEFPSPENTSDLENERRGLIEETKKLDEAKTIKLAKLLNYATVEGPDEALKMVLVSIQEATNKSELETIQLKMTNIDKIEVE
jgi:hypothetical protein